MSAAPAVLPDLLAHIATASGIGMTGPAALRSFYSLLEPSATEAEAEADLAEPLELVAMAEEHARSLERMTDLDRRAFAEAFVNGDELTCQLPAAERAALAAAAAERLNQLARAAVAAAPPAPAAAAPGTEAPRERGTERTCA